MIGPGPQPPRRQVTAKRMVLARYAPPVCGLQVQPGGSVPSAALVFAALVRNFLGEAGAGKRELALDHVVRRERSRNANCKLLFAALALIDPVMLNYFVVSALKRDTSWPGEMLNVASEHALDLARRREFEGIEGNDLALLSPDSLSLLFAQIIARLQETQLQFTYACPVPLPLRVTQRVVAPLGAPWMMNNCGPMTAVIVLSQFLQSDAGRPFLDANPAGDPRDQLFWRLYDRYLTLLRGCTWRDWLEWHQELYPFLLEGFFMLPNVSARIAADPEGAAQFLRVGEFTNWFDCFDCMVIGTALHMATTVQYKARCRRPDCGAAQKFSRSILHSPLGPNALRLVDTCNEQRHSDFAVGGTILQEDTAGAQSSVFGFRCTVCNQQSVTGEGALSHAPALLTLAFRSESSGSNFQLRANTEVKVTDRPISVLTLRGTEIYAPCA